MYGVNREKGSGVCRGCLSSDRRLSPLVHSELYATFLNKDAKAMDTLVVLFCWECAALMRRVHHFQLQTQKADKMLSGSLETFLIKKSLSYLIISHKHDYDVIIEEKYDTSDKFDICDIDIKEEDKHKEENSENCTVVKIEDNDSDGSGRLDDDYLDLKVRSDEENTETTINSRKRKQETDTIEFVAASLLTKRRSERIKNVVAEPKPKPQKKIKLKTVKGKNKNGKRKNVLSNIGSKAEGIPVNIRIKNELEIHLSDFQEGVGENSIKNDFDKKSGIQQETDNLNVNTDKVPDENMKSESCDSDSKGDSDYFEAENDVKVKKASKTNGSKKRHFKQHLIRRNIFRYTCDQLDEYFSKVDVADEMTEEVLKSEPKYTTKERPFGCEYCGLCFKLKRHLYRHQEKKHKQISIEMSIKDPTSPLYCRYMYRCNICHKVLRKEYSEAHMKYLHRVRYTCTECDAIFWERSAAEEHRNSAHKTFTCTICNVVKLRKSALDNHIQKWHTPVTCDDCGEQLEMRKLLLKHRTDKHPDSNPELRYCVQCNVQYSSVSRYQYHLKYTKAHRTGPSETYPCTECTLVLASKRSLKYHRERIHRGKTPFQCPHCGKLFGRQRYVRYHIDSAHLKVPKPKNKMCPYCDRGFSNKNILIHHIRTHTGERPHQCTYCPAAFAQPYPLKKHLENVHRHTTDTAQRNITEPQALQNDSNSLT